MTRTAQILALSAVLLSAPAAAEMKLSGKLMVVGGELLAAQQACGFDVDSLKLVALVRYTLEEMVPGVSEENFVFFLDGQRLSTLDDFRKMSPKRRVHFCKTLKTTASRFGVLNER